MKVSIIIPCYNSEKFISQAINCALAQTYNDIEIIIVDNGSTDGTLSKIEEFKKKFPQKIRVLQELNRGASIARNRGLVESKGEWIQFLDSDDIILPAKIEDQVRCLGTGCTFIVGDYIVVNREDSGENINVIRANRDVWAGLIDSRLGITSANLFSKPHLIDVGGWDYTLASSQEYDLMFRLLKSDGGIVYSSSLNTIIYKQTESVSATKDDEKFQCILTNMIELRRRIKAFLISRKQFSNRLNRIYGTFIYKKLWMHRRRLPGFFSQNIKKEKLTVPISVKCKITLNYYLKGLKDLNG